MAKKEKVQLTPEELAAKKLNTKKGWARVGAVVLALALTFAVYKLGSKGGPKEEDTTTQPATQAVQQQQTTKKAETTTAAPTTAAPTTAKPATTAPTTKAASQGSDDSSPLAGIGDALSGLLGGGSLPDASGAADTVESVGGTIKDFFYGIADKVEQEPTTK